MTPAHGDLQQTASPGIADKTCSLHFRNRHSPATDHHFHSSTSSCSSRYPLGMCAHKPNRISLTWYEINGHIFKSGVYCPSREVFMSTVRRKYTQEFKDSAVKLITEQGYQLSEASRNLGVNISILRRWRNASISAEKSKSVSMKEDVHAELARLRK